VDLSNLNRTAIKTSESGFTQGEVWASQPKTLDDSTRRFKLVSNNSGWTWIGWAAASRLSGSELVQSGYFLYSPNSRLFSGEFWGEIYGKRIVKVGGIIESILDTKAKCIRYIIDGDDLGVAYKNIHQVDQLQPCIVMLHETSSWTLQE